LHEGKRLGEALRHFDTVEDVSIGGGSPNEIEQLFEALREQRHITSVVITSVGVSDSICDYMSGWDNVTEISIISTRITGERFPNLPKLTAIDASYSPITDKGFAKLLSLPALEVLTLKQPTLTAAGLSNPRDVSKTARDVTISLSGIPLEEARRIESIYHEKWPKLQIDIR
jgi:hypothetical protein